MRVSWSACHRGKFDWCRSIIPRDRRPGEHRQTGGGVPSASLARFVGRAHGSPRGGAMPAGADLTVRWDCRPRHRSPRGGRGATGPCSGSSQGVVGASAGARGTRGARRLVVACVDRGLRGPPCAVRAARVRRCAKFWSITKAWVMTAMIRMGPRHAGPASGLTATICGRSAAVGPSPTDGWPRSAPASARGRSWRAPWRGRALPDAISRAGGWQTRRRTAWSRSRCRG